MEFIENSFFEKCAIISFFAIVIVFCVIFFNKYISTISEKQCINYYLETGYILDECKCYDNLKKED